MHYLVDAYNLLFRVLKKRGSLEKSRQSLIEELNEMTSQLNLHVTLVFDGAEEHLRGHFDTLEIVYTRKTQTADEYISEEVFLSRSPSQLTVVTNDRELSTRCSHHLAKTMSIDEFLHLISKKKMKKKRLGPPRTFRDSQSQIARLLIIFEKKMLEDLTKDFF
ncbi:MAG: NYN domain-containing protein [Rhabdochlamydiaceae bacterium]|jgi:predicted RNA-binding protein with PIN domain